MKKRTAQKIDQKAAKTVVNRFLNLPDKEQQVVVLKGFQRQLVNGLAQNRYGSYRSVIKELKALLDKAIALADKTNESSITINFSKETQLKFEKGLHDIEERHPVFGLYWKHVKRGKRYLLKDQGGNLVASGLTKRQLEALYDSYDGYVDYSEGKELKLYRDAPETIHLHQLYDAFPTLKPSKDSIISGIANQPVKTNQKSLMADYHKRLKEYSIQRKTESSELRLAQKILEKFTDNSDNNFQKMLTEWLSGKTGTNALRSLAKDVGFDYWANLQNSNAIDLLDTVSASIQSGARTKGLQGIKLSPTEKKYAPGTRVRARCGRHGEVVDLNTQKKGKRKTYSVRVLFDSGCRESVKPADLTVLGDDDGLRGINSVVHVPTSPAPLPTYAPKPPTFTPVPTSVPVQPESVIPAPDQGNIPELNGLQTMATVGQEIGPIETFNIIGEFGTFLGPIKREPQSSVVVALSGEKGLGKSHGLFQLLNEIAGSGYTALFGSYEEFVNSSLFIEKRDKYIEDHNRSLITAVDKRSVPNAETFLQLANHYDVIVLDSAPRLPGGVDVDHLRDNFKGKLFIIIYHATTEGKLKGGTDPQHDADVVIVGEKHDDFTKNYFHYGKDGKNRYQTAQGLKYNIYHQKLID